MTEKEELILKAATFDRLIKHLKENTDVQNIDLMITGRFCRNCLYKWYKKAGESIGVYISKEDAQKAIYGMDYEDYKESFQKPVSKEKMNLFNKIHKPH